MSALRQFVFFLLVSAGVSVGVYSDAIWGDSLLAPLDLGPAIFETYDYMDPDFEGIPDNHFIVDQFTYDLPLQKRIHDSYQSAEIPWWDPYTYGGRPLLADAHINGTDPIRVACYLALPFELAYNWNIILRSILTGCGIFLLLRQLDIRLSIAVILGIAYQFSGWFTMYIGHPWIQGSFAYYPFILLSWINASKANFGSWTALAAILCAAVFYSGNLQSHTYLPVFAFVFLLTGFFSNRAIFSRAFSTIALSGLIGALIAYPVLVNQVEFFLLNQRATERTHSLLGQILSIPISLSGFFPWIFGTFRTLNPARIVGVPSLEFNLFFGTIAGFFAMLGASRALKAKDRESWMLKYAVSLVMVYLVFISTPLYDYFYPRSSALAGIGLTLLAGLGTESFLRERTATKEFAVKWFCIAILSISALVSLASWILYPRYVYPMTEKILERFSKQPGLLGESSLAELRRFQIQNFATEVSLLNPEVAISVIAVILLMYGSLRAPRNHKEKILIATLALSTIPVVMFHKRFLPKHSIEMWHKMVEGGSEQKKALRMAGKTLRIDETSVDQQQLIFPNATAALYGIHAVQGYSALQPASIYNTPNGEGSSGIPSTWRADIRHVEPTSVLLATVDSLGSSRFRMSSTGLPAPIDIVEETMNSITLKTPKLPMAEGIIRTDTWYPGWTVDGANTLEFHPPIFSLIVPDDSNSSKTIKLKYTPTGLKGAPVVVSSGLGCSALLLFSSLFRRKNRK